MFHIGIESDLVTQRNHGPLLSEASGVGGLGDPRAIFQTFILGMPCWGGGLDITNSPRVLSRGRGRGRWDDRPWPWPEFLDDDDAW